MADWQRTTAGGHSGLPETEVVYAYAPNVMLSAFLSPKTGLWNLSCNFKKVAVHDSFDDLNDHADLIMEKPK